jgi:prepilin peptidase CpaA
MTEASLLGIFPLLVAYAAFSDLFTMTIPNRVSLLLIAAFAVMAPFAGFGPGEFAWHVAAMVTVFAACLPLFATGAMGGGDAKLLTAISLWFGMSAELMTFLVYTALIGGVLTLVLLKLRTPAGLYVLSHVPMTHNLTDSSKGIPYGIAIGAAALICYPQTPMMHEALAAMAAR